jgi:hypothetical protein
MAARIRLPALEALATRFSGAFARDTRALTCDERDDAISVFGDALDLDPIRIVSTSIVNSPTCLGNIIRVAGGGEIDRITLIHELAHVWQYQTRGAEYISDSAWHQVSAALTTGSRQAAYLISFDDLAAASIFDLPAEKQAVIIERWFADPGLRVHADYRRFLSEVRHSTKTS